MILCPFHKSSSVQSSRAAYPMVAIGVRLFELEMERLKSVMVKNRLVFEVKRTFSAQPRFLVHSRRCHGGCVITVSH
ncbi:hypothetical protein L484_027666 [Morus notabilis]|uniref:Uncharacterized protein n=1 Tax=Morus notabilis TaxID=981085 RepID=W9RMZ8_9ROSA|nr:hypothetical protein L484_027666 [Morus notabilis]